MTKKWFLCLFCLSFCVLSLSISALADNDPKPIFTPEEVVVSTPSSKNPILQDSLFYVTDHSVYFADVIEKHAWAINEIDYLANAKIVSGTGNCLFSPESTIRRADFLLMLYRAYDMSLYVNDTNFADVPKTAYYADALSACKALGIATGDEKDNFFPNDVLTRQDAMVFLNRTLARTGLRLPTGNLSEFSDASSIADYAVDSVSALVRAGVISGSDGKLNPKAEVSRASMAVMLYHALMLTVENGEVRYVPHPNLMNICIGRSFYPNVTIRNMPEAGLKFGLYELVELYKTDAGYEIVMGNPSDFHDQVTFRNDKLIVNGKVVDTNGGYEAIAVDVYGLLDGLYPTGRWSGYSGAAAVIKDGSLVTIYYKK